MSGSAYYLHIQALSDAINGIFPHVARSIRWIGGFGVLPGEWEQRYDSGEG